MDRREKAEVGFTDKYKRSFRGRPEDPKEIALSLRNYRANYDRIKWDKKR